MKIESRNLLVLAVVFALTIAATAFTPSFASNKQMKIAYGGTSASSGSYAWCVAMAEAINKAVPECYVTVIETGASIENLHLLYRGDINMGMATVDAAARAYHGRMEFAKKANPNLRLLWNWLALPHTVFVTQKSGVKSIYALKGKKFGCGMTGSATAAMTLALFDACDIHPNWFYGGTGANRDAAKNRQIIGYVKSGVPDASVMDVASVLPIRLLPVSDTDLAKAPAKYPGMFTRGYAPANAYGKDIPPQNIPSFNVVCPDVCTKDLPADLVYKMAKAMYEARDNFGKAYKPATKPMADYPRSLIKAATIPLHSGVVKLCKELGIEVPAKLIPPEYKDF